MGMVGKLAGNVELERRFLAFQQNVKDGCGLSESAVRAEAFPNMVCQILAIAEEQGNLADLVAQLGSLYEEEVEHSLKTAASLFEPLALCTMGLVVGLVVLATAQPTLNLVGSL